MRVIHIYITFLLLSLPILGHAQTYIQGEDFLPFSQVGRSEYLTSKTLISLDKAFERHKEIEGGDFKETITQLRGEYYTVDGMLTSLNCSELSTLRKNKYRGIQYTYEYIKHSSDPEYWHLMYKDLGTHKIMISYPKKSQRLYYYIENETYSIMGAVYTPKNKIGEAQKLIEKLVESISFKK